MADSVAEADPSAPLTELVASSSEHSAPADGLECMATMEDITLDDGNYCEYQTAPSMKWHPSLYSSEVVRRLINTQFPEYVSGVRKADCEADLKRRIGKGPPIWVEDKHAMPVPEEDTHICRVWFSGDGKEYSAKLRGALEGAERDALWEELKNFLPPAGSESAPAADEEGAPPASE